MAKKLLISWLCFESFLFSGDCLNIPELNLRSVDTADYDIYEFNTAASTSGLQWYHKTGVFSSTNREYSAYVATFEPAYFAFLPPTPQGCTEYVKTSVSSNITWDCDYATNGGFFTWDVNTPIKCVGNLLSDGNLIVQEGMGNANFGLTNDGLVIAGFVDDDLFSNQNITELMSGSGWLVRHGISYVSQSADLDVSSSFVTEKAPRTAVGLFLNGSMALVEVDGEEDISYGPDLFEFAELLVELGLDTAINIDGGGSSVSVSDGSVISQPTCNDNSTVCEREVQSITCVRKEKKNQWKH
jgi:N-acetylglucosamine-1-phosphodiester alpha-N-acetylglucosaminidase